MTDIGDIIAKPELCTGCLRCAMACSFFNSGKREFNLSEANIRIEADIIDFEFKIVILDSCTRCGICVEYCEFDALSQVEEVVA